MFSFTEIARYGRLPQQEVDIEEVKEPSSSAFPSCSSRALFVHAVLLSLSLYLFVASRLPQNHSDPIASNAQSLDASLWSPELAAIPTVETKFRGSFLAPSKYRGASPEANTAWDEYTLNPYVDGTAVVLGVTKEDIRKNNKLDDEDWFNSTVVLQASEDENETKYMATLEVFHQVHCLDMLRKFTFGNQFHDDFGWKHGPEMLRNHLDHCLEMIRQVLMCNSDPRLITFHWVKDNSVPYPDFNTWHQCRDADATLKWAKQNAWPLDHVIVKKGSVVDMPIAP